MKAPEGRTWRGDVGYLEIDLDTLREDPRRHEISRAFQESFLLDFSCTRRHTCLVLLIFQQVYIP